MLDHLQVKPGSENSAVDVVIEGTTSVDKSNYGRAIPVEKQLSSKVIESANPSCCAHPQVAELGEVVAKAWTKILRKLIGRRDACAAVRFTDRRSSKRHAWQLALEKDHRTSVLIM